MLLATLTRLRPVELPAACAAPAACCRWSSCDAWPRRRAAAGIDPAKASIFIQSHVTAHAELAWLLQCVTPIGWLNRMIQFKEKARKQVGVRGGSKAGRQAAGGHAGRRAIATS